MHTTFFSFFSLFIESLLLFIYEFFILAYSRIWAQFFKGVKHRGGLIHKHGLIPGQTRYLTVIVG